MVIQKLRLFLEEIEAFINCWDILIDDELENCGQANAEHVGRLFEAI